MRRLLPLFCAIAFWLSPAPAQAPNAAFEGIDEAVRQLASITGLPPLKKVQADTITRAGVRQFLEERIREEIDPEEIRLEELLLKRLGLIPNQFDLKSATVDLVTEQAAAFYDYRKKRLFLLDGDDPSTDGAPPGFASGATRMIVVHELAHALADQHFDLGRFIKKGRSDDAASARMAVMEGQATWLMLEFMMSGLNQSLRTRPSMTDSVGSGAAGAMEAQYPVLAKAPLYLRTSLLFPYNQGLTFQHEVVRRLGNNGFSEIFRKPPVSTQQILHPELYFSGTVPAKVSLPPLPRHSRTLIESSMGELDHSVLIEQYVSKDEAASLSPQWRGAAVALTESKKDKSVALVYAAEWTGDAAARRMLAAWRAMLEQRSPGLRVESESENEFRATGPHGSIVLKVSGKRLTVTEGLAGAPPRLG